MSELAGLFDGLPVSIKVRLMVGIFSLLCGGFSMLTALVDLILWCTRR